MRTTTCADNWRLFCPRYSWTSLHVQLGTLRASSKVGQQRVSRLALTSFGLVPGLTLYALTDSVPAEGFYPDLVVSIPEFPGELPSLGQFLNL